MINYAGVDLLLPTPELEAFVKKYLGQDYISQFQVFYNDICGYFPLPFAADGSIRFNTLVWPRDAGRWSYGHFLATTTMIEKINAVVDTQYVSGYSSGSGWCSGASGSSGSGISSGNCVCSGSGSGVSGGAGRYLDGATLQMSTKLDSTPAINCKMYMLPPTPIARMPYNRSNTCAEAYEGLWLVTLVDDRFWWNMRGHSSDSIVGGTWNDMFANMVSSIGQSTADIIETSSPYGAIPTDMTEVAWQAQMAHVFDCYLYQTQKRLIKGLNGTVHIVGPETAKQYLAANAQQNWFLTAGGGSRMSPLVAWGNTSFTSTVSDLPVIPHKECQDLRHILSRGVTFIKGDGSYTTVENPYVAPAAADRYKVFSVKGSPSAAYMKAFAKDWFEWRRSHLGFTIPGIYPYEPTGYEDYIEFHHGSDFAYTRIVRGQVNDINSTLLNCLCSSGYTTTGLAEVVSDVLCSAGKTTIKYRTIDARYTD